MQDVPMTEYAIEYDNGKGGILVKAETEAEALEIAWQYVDIRAGVGGDKSKLTVRVVE